MDVPIYTCNSSFVVTYRTNNAANTCTMCVGSAEWIVIVLLEIPPNEIIAKAIAIIIGSIRPPPVIE